MKAEQLAHCCGAAVFHNFGHTIINAEQSPNGFGKLPPTPDEIDTWLANQERFQSQCLGVGVVVCTLNDQQLEKLGHIFDKRGYKVDGPHYNPKHRTSLYVLTKGLIPVPENKPEPGIGGWGDRDRDRVGHGGYQKDLTVQERKEIATAAGQLGYAEALDEDDDD